MAEDVIFTPSQKARDFFKAIWNEANDQATEEFFRLWEMEGDARASFVSA